MSFQLLQPFDAATIEPYEGGYTSVPTGIYKVQIIESSGEPIANGTKGGALVLWLGILDGAYAGQKIRYGLNLYYQGENAEVTVKTAHSQLSALCHVTRVKDLQNTGQLHGIPFQVAVVNDGQFSNVKAVADINGLKPGKKGGQLTAPAAVGAPAAPSAPPAAAVPGAPPGWSPAGAPTAPAAPAQSWNPTPAAAPPAPPTNAPALWNPNPPTTAAPAATGWQQQPNATPGAAPWDKR